jgi:hypothetical protein
MAIFDNFRDPKNTQPTSEEYTDDDLYNGFMTGDPILTDLFIAKVKEEAAKLEAKEDKK